MKRMTWLVGIAALAAMPLLAQAQSTTSRPISFGVSGGASIPMGDLRGYSDVGYELGAHLLLMPASLSHVSFRGDVSVDKWGQKGGSTIGLKTRILAVTVNAIVKSSQDMTIKPYVIAGGGLYNNKITSDFGDGSSQSKFGLQGGGGLEFKLSGFTTFLEAKFVGVFKSGTYANRFGTDVSATHYLPVTFGIRF